MVLDSFFFFKLTIINAVDEFVRATVQSDAAHVRSGKLPEK